MASSTAHKTRFGPFELDSQSGELFKLGHKLNLRGQPIEVLSILLERPGEVITREELCKRLWSEDTFVDFEHSLNTAIKKLRQALDDDVETPRYIETLPKKGYRFVGQVESAANRAGAAAEAGRAEPDAQPDSTQQAGNLPGLKLLANSDARAARLKSCPDTKPSQLGQPMVRTGKAQRWRYVVAVALILGAAAGALYWLVRPRVPVVTRMHQLTRTGNAKILQAPKYLVTDGSRIYFTDLVKGRVRIAQVSVQGGEVSYIDIPTVELPHVRDISENGSQLLLIDWGPNKPDQPWILSLPNGPAIKTPFTTSFAFSFLPGEKRVLYADMNHLFTANLDGSDMQQVITLPFAPWAAVPSPDGKKIRYLVNGHIWECRIDGRGAHRFLLEWKQPVSVIGWSPDGNTFVFQSRDEEGPNLWAVAERRIGPFQFASKPTRITSGPLAFRAWAFAKDGKRMYAIGESKLGELSLYDSKSGAFAPYMNGIPAAHTDFSRDGQWVTYVTYPEVAIWKSRIDGSERLRLTMPTANVLVNPKWSPDGRMIAYCSWEANHVWESSEFSHKIYAVPADGGAPMLLLSGKFNPCDPNWSADGKSLVYSGDANSTVIGQPGARSDEEETEIRILDVGSMQSRTLPGSKGYFSARWSRDGRFIAGVSPVTGALWLHDVETGQSNEVPIGKWRVPGMGWITFSHDSQYVYGTSNNQVFRVRLPNGPAELVADLSGMHLTDPAFSTGWFGLTPDDRVLVLQDRGTQEIYALDLEYR